MTTIKLTTSDQALISAKKVKIAAGDINSVLLHVDFDDAWNNFPNRKALFANGAVNGGTTIEALMVGGECTIPHEVLSTEGIMSISVTGYTSDGTTKKTSAVVKQKITYSLKDSSTTVAPTMDLYMQYLAALNDKLNPVTEGVALQLAEQQKVFYETIETVEASVENTLAEQNENFSNQLSQYYTKGEADAEIKESYDKSRTNAKADLRSRQPLWQNLLSVKGSTFDPLDSIRLTNEDTEGDGNYLWGGLAPEYVRIEVLFQVDTFDVDSPTHILQSFRRDAASIVEDGKNPKVFTYQVQQILPDNTVCTRTVAIGEDFIEFSDCSCIKNVVVEDDDYESESAYKIEASATVDNYKLVPIAIFGYEF